MIRAADAEPIRLGDVSITYNTGVRAVDGVSFAIREGEFVSLIGPSGCGKSTIANALAKLLPPSLATVSGVIELKADRIGYMFQRDTLLPWRTVARNIETGLEIRGVAAAERAAVAEGLLESFGLAGFGGMYPYQLSGGMRQRASLARTLAYDPDVVLMDEPFGALDAQTRVVLQAEFMRISAENRKTVLLITHDLAEAITMSDRVLLMTHRPSRLHSEYVVDLDDRSDPLALRSDPRFIALHSRIWDVLSAEVRQQYAE